MSEFEGQIIGKERFGPSPLLRDVLAEVTFKPGRAISPDIDSLDLGVFSEEARHLANECFVDENNLAKAIIVTGRKKVLIPNKEQRATRHVIMVAAIVDELPKRTALEKGLNTHYLSMIMHTADNTDNSFSQANALLLTADDSTTALSSLFIVGRSQNMLFFRGQNTPQLTEEEVARKGTIWESQLNERISQNIKPEMHQMQRLDIAIRAEGALMRQICEKYDLKLFTGPTDSPIVKRQNL